MIPIKSTFNWDDGIHFSVQAGATLPRPVNAVRGTWRSITVLGGKGIRLAPEYKHNGRLETCRRMMVFCEGRGKYLAAVVPT